MARTARPTRSTGRRTGMVFPCGDDPAAPEVPACSFDGWELDAKGRCTFPERCVSREYPAGTRGLDDATAHRLTRPLPERLSGLALQGRRFPLCPSERDAVADGAAVDVRFFRDGDVLWAELRD